MRGAGWQVVDVDGVERIDVAGVHWHPLRRTLGVGAFGVNAYSADAGEDVVETHTERLLRHQEIYVVLRGRATFTVGEEPVDARAGTVVFLEDPELRRGAVAAEDGTLVLAVGAPVGEPYTPSAWEHAFAAARHRATGDWDAAIAELDEAIGQHPDRPELVYDKACYLALAGRSDEALDLLASAVASEPRLAASALGDDDLTSLRTDPRFPPPPAE